METVFGIPVINVLWTIVAGKRFDRDDAKVQRMMIFSTVNVLVVLYVVLSYRECLDCLKGCFNWNIFSPGGVLFAILYRGFRPEEISSLN